MNRFALQTIDEINQILCFLQIISTFQCQFFDKGVVQSLSAHIVLRPYHLQKVGNFLCDDIETAAQGIPVDKASILLIHSPEKIPEAAAAGFNAYFCGHTHGGQIGLPLIGTPFTNSRCQRRFTNGAFEYEGMQGYTHRGTGASSVAVRFRSPSEIVIHTLRKM